MAVIVASRAATAARVLAAGTLAPSGFFAAGCFTTPGRARAVVFGFGVGLSLDCEDLDFSGDSFPANRLRGGVARDIRFAFTSFRAGVADRFAAM
ncbi:MAG: hypothetical protein ACTHN2_12115 [Nitrobacter sp.]